METYRCKVRTRLAQKVLLWNWNKACLNSENVRSPFQENVIIHSILYIPELSLFAILVNVCDKLCGPLSSSCGLLTRGSECGRCPEPGSHDWRLKNEHSFNFGNGSENFLRSLGFGVASKSRLRLKAQWDCKIYDLLVKPLRRMLTSYWRQQKTTRDHPPTNRPLTKYVYVNTLPNKGRARGWTNFRKPRCVVTKNQLNTPIPPCQKVALLTDWSMNRE